MPTRTTRKLFQRVLGKHSRLVCVRLVSLCTLVTWPLTSFHRRISLHATVVARWICIYGDLLSRRSLLSSAQTALVTCNSPHTTAQKSPHDHVQQPVGALHASRYKRMDGARDWRVERIRRGPVWKSTSDDDAAVLAPSSVRKRHLHAIEQASRRRRGA